jgi:hypothetical protein
MKIFIPICLAGLFSLSYHPPIHFLPAKNSDTAVITHVQDGKISEWPETIFQTNKETSIQYAVDNDAQNLYIAMKIPDFRIQLKMMRMGMNVFIDLKGKKKEGRGIEFPIKRENEGGFGGGGFGNRQGYDQNQQGANQQGNFDKKAIRARFAIYLLSMKLFGFTDGDPVAQELNREGSVNLAYSWDSTDVMSVEYLVPLNMLGDAASLTNKTISLGWKINGIELPSGGLNQGSSSTTLQARPSGGGSGFNNRGGGGGGNFGGNNGPNQADIDKMMQDQSFWTKYIFH